MKTQDPGTFGTHEIRSYRLNYLALAIYAKNTSPDSASKFADSDPPIAARDTDRVRIRPCRTVPHLFSGNAEFLDALYKSYLDNPENVDPAWRSFFAELGTAQLSAGSNGGDVVGTQARSAVAEKQVKVLEFISANRYRGHREANLDPLNLYEPPKMPELHLDHYGFTDADLDRRFNTASLFMESEASLREIRDLVKTTYCATIGTELTHITATHEKRWIQERLERVHGQFNFSSEKKRDILRWVTSARKLEDYLHRRYVGQKRFSLEGGEALIPLLDEVVQQAGGQHIKEIVIGMAHRGGSTC